MNTGFSHLHVHTEYSPLDGMCKLEELILRAKELGQTSVAITDHGTLYSLWKAQKLAEKHGIKVIKGCEFYFINGYEDGKPIIGHLILLAKSYKGVVNLYKLQEVAFENFYRKHLISFTDLEKYNEDLICTSACMANVIPQAILSDNRTLAVESIKKFKSIFGDDFYLEIQPLTIPEQAYINKEIVKLSKELNVPLVATNDVHYVYKDDWKVHEVLLALSTKRKMNDPKRFKFPTNDFWLKSEEEMKDGFKYLSNDDVSNALYNTSVIADRCNANIPTGHYLPTFPFTPQGKNSENYFKEKVWEGYEIKKDESIDDKEYIKAIEQEIDVITSEGYTDYFLIVQDYIKKARDNGLLVGDGRGSASGSKVAYSMDITRVEPRQYGLLFERFLAKGREPDIDTDFSNIDKIFEILGNSYGWENVGRIVSFGTFAPRAITRRVLQIFGHKEGEIKKITSLLPFDPSLKWKDCLENKEYVKAMEKYKDEWVAIQRLQGNVSHTSMHAGGIVIWNSLSDILPVKCINNLKDERIKRVVCFDMDDLHEVGVFKFDLLGLNTLEILDLALKNVKEIHGVDIDLSKINYEDENVIKAVGMGDVLGIFQLEEQIERVMQQLPKNFRDFIAINALIRPGSSPRYFTKRKGETPYSIIKERQWYMNETYGEYVYQEQYMLDAHVLAGWDLAYADKHLRKNKDIRNDIELRNKFYKDCKSIGIVTKDSDIAEIWADIENTVDGGYGFNKSHSACYARIAFQEAYLKYYYPECYYSAILTKRGDNQEKIGEIIAECKSKGIKILPPDINKSEDNFIPTPSGIRYRLTSITNVGDSAIRGIKEIRPIKGLQDLLERRNKSLIKRNVVESLIKAGVFDFENPNRQEVMFELDQFHRTKTQIKEGYKCPLREFDKMRWEKEALGIYLSSHPLEKYAFRHITDFGDNANCLIAGIVEEVNTLYDRKGKQMAFITISNQYGSIKTIAFSSTWKNKELQEKMVDGNIIMVRGKRSKNDCIIDSVEVIDKISS